MLLISLKGSHLSSSVSQHETFRDKRSISLGDMGRGRGHTFEGDAIFQYKSYISWLLM